MRDTRPRRRHYLLIVITLAGILFGTGSAYAKCTLMGENIRADFDGDGIHDLVSGGVSQSGFTYLISIRISRRHTTSLLRTDTVFPLGYRLIPADVDLDGDADLVLSRGVSLPVAVWTNDGRGHFATKPAWDVAPGLNTIHSGYSLRMPRTPSTGTTHGKRISAPDPVSPFFEVQPADYRTHFSSREISRSTRRQPLRGPPPLFA